MSQYPPESGGWTDPYGTWQPGFPPPGYWQASDERWYPPETRPAEPATPFAEDVTMATPSIVAPSGPPPGGPGPVGFGNVAPGPGPGPGPSGFGVPAAGPGWPQAPPRPPGALGASPLAPNPARGSKRTGLFIVLGVVAALFVGCGAIGVLAVGRFGDAIDEVTDDFATTLPLAVDTTGVDAPPSEAEDDLDDLASLLDANDGLGDVAGCTRLDGDTLQVDLTNNSGVKVDYWLTIDLIDEAGQTVSETSGFVEDLRPGERTVETVFIFDSTGATCSIKAADRFDVATGSAGSSDVSGCEAVSPDSFGDVTATLIATNSATSSSDYVITVAVVGADGIRRGSGYAFIEDVGAGLTGATELLTTIDYVDGDTCEIVTVDRSTS